MTTHDGQLGEILDRAHGLLIELYTPAGVLIFWSSRNKLLGGERPCDLVREGDVAGLNRLCDYLDAMADGAFL